MTGRFELVVFDLDGVLADSTPAHADAWDELWASLHMAGPDYPLVAGRRTADVVEELTRHLPATPDDRAAWVRFKQAAARRRLAESSPLFADTRPLLDALDGAHRPYALATGASRKTAEIVLAHAGGIGRFRAAVTADDVAAGKPDPETYRRVVERAGTQPERAMAVEDSSAGVMSALEAGLSVVTVRTGVTVDHPRFLGAHADLASLARAIGWTS